MENLTAKVAQPNTPETDGMLDVNHIVSWTENNVQKSMTVLARDPMEAIRLIQRLYSAELGTITHDYELKSKKTK